MGGPLIHTYTDKWGGPLYPPHQHSVQAHVGDYLPPPSTHVGGPVPTHTGTYGQMGGPLPSAHAAVTDTWEALFPPYIPDKWMTLPSIHVLKEESCVEGTKGRVIHLSTYTVCMC